MPVDAWDRFWRAGPILTQIAEDGRTLVELEYPVSVLVVSPRIAAIMRDTMRRLHLSGSPRLDGREIRVRVEEMKYEETCYEDSDQPAIDAGPTRG